MLSGCIAPRGVLVEIGAESLPRCEVDTLQVEEIAQHGAHGCNLEGTDILLPHNLQARVSKVGSAASTSRIQVHPEDGNRYEQFPEYYVLNWGSIGISVTQVEEGVATDSWTSSPDAFAKQLESLRMNEIQVEFENPWK